MSLATIVFPTPPLGCALIRVVLPKANVAILVVLYNSLPFLDGQGLKLPTVVERMSVSCAELALHFALIGETILVRELVDYLSLLRLLELLCLLMNFFLVGSLLFLVKNFLPHSFIVLLAYFFLLDVLFCHEGSVEGGFEGRPLRAEAL